ncbi:MAG: F0F1 ATP synthase subunit epsilon, partial [Gemmatimonadota bacterium]|nr:F0F1 ATP synthase subunit epsilon [Gemmatimonadota bacterium]
MLNVSVISPERVLFEGPAKSLVAPAFDGEIGILPMHAPLMTLLGQGVLRVEGGEGGAQRFTIDGG